MSERDHTRSPEQDLWQAVLMRQVEDALYSVTGVTGYKRHVRLRICVEARVYLTTPSRGLFDVCTSAGLDMHAVIEAMKKRIAEAPSPEQIISKARSKFTT